MSNPTGPNYENNSDGQDFGADLFKATAGEFDTQHDPVPSSSPIPGIEFAVNPDPRCPCMLVLDTSSSMKGQRIEALNLGLQTLRDELINDPHASKRVEVAVVTFGGSQQRPVQVIQDFTTVDRFRPPQLQAGGLTFMGTGILKGLELIESRKANYNQNGIAFYRPWLFMITDGEPKGEDLKITREAMDRVKAAEAARKVAFFAVGVDRANMKLLSKFSAREPRKLRGLSFVELFQWLSRSTQQVSRSQPGTEQVALPPATWATV